MCYTTRAGRVIVRALPQVQRERRKAKARRALLEQAMATVEEEQPMYGFDNVDGYGGMMPVPMPVAYMPPPPPGKLSRPQSPRMSPRGAVRSPKASPRQLSPRARSPRVAMPMMPAMPAMRTMPSTFGTRPRGSDCMLVWAWLQFVVRSLGCVACTRPRDPLVTSSCLVCFGVALSCLAAAMSPRMMFGGMVGDDLEPDPWANMTMPVPLYQAAPTGPMHAQTAPTWVPARPNTSWFY